MNVKRKVKSNSNYSYQLENKMYTVNYLYIELKMVSAMFPVFSFPVLKGFTTFV